MVAPRASWHPGILPLRATSRRCPNQTGTPAWRRTDHVIAVQTVARVHEACCQACPGSFDMTTPPSKMS